MMKLVLVLNLTHTTLHVSTNFISAAQISTVITLKAIAHQNEGYFLSCKNLFIWMT